MLVKTPPVLIQLADYNQTTSCQFMASMLGACAAGGAVFAASQLGPESGKDAPWMPALAAAGAGAGVSALGGLICTSSAPKQVGRRHHIRLASLNSCGPRRRHRHRHHCRCCGGQFVVHLSYP